MDTLLKTALDALRNGETLLYPTDTIWGIGCDATDATAVERIYALKERDHSKSMLVLCADLAMVEAFVGKVGEACAQLLLHSDRPTTVILPWTTWPPQTAPSGCGFQRWLSANSCCMPSGSPW